MGTPVAVTFACIYLGMLEREAFSKMQTFPFKIYKRYIDDLFGLPKSKQLLLEFIDIFKNLRPSIKITYEINQTQINFLDITIYKGSLYHFNNRFDIKVYQKPINKYVYLPPTSFHSKNVFKFITGELRRYRLICNNDTDYYYIKEQFRTRLLDRGYTTSYLHSMMMSDKTFLNNRTEMLLNFETKQLQQTNCPHIPILFKTIHNPRLKHINIRKCLEIPEFLYQDPNTKLVFNKQTTPLLCLKRSINLREQLCKSRYAYEVFEPTPEPSSPNNAPNR
jgi:hypothetical protein